MVRVHGGRFARSLQEKYTQWLACGAGALDSTPVAALVVHFPGRLGIMGLIPSWAKHFLVALHHTVTRENIYHLIKYSSSHEIKYFLFY